MEQRRIDASARSALEKRPALQELVNVFAAFFTQKSRLVEDLRQESAAVALDPSVDRVAEGVPICAAMSFETLTPALNRTLDTLLAVVKETFPAMSQEVTQLETALKRTPPNLAQFAKDHLEGDRTAYESQGQILGVAAGTLEFVIGLTVATVLESLEPMLAEKIREIPWQEGYCPICGSLPSISYLAASADLSADFLKGGGGQRHLHCSNCGHEWRIKRNFCPACGNDHPDMQVYYRVPEEPSERVDICRKCNLYLPCIDLREIDTEPHMDMAAVGMVHLDAYAQKDGFKPMAWTPWNRLE
jgi:FdhE protein